MKYISTDDNWMPFLCHQLAIDAPARGQVIMCCDDGEPIAGGLLEGYNTVSAHCHIWVAEGRIPSRDWMVAIFDYPFNRLGLKKLFGRVVSENESAVKLDEHFGFSLEARIEDYSPFGDLLLYSMTREQCKVLNDPKWSRVVSRVAAIE